MMRNKENKLHEGYINDLLWYNEYDGHVWYGEFLFYNDIQCDIRQTDGGIIYRHGKLNEKN